ncbi:MAG: nucleoside-diphosphate kinase [Bacteroidota bacterium]
MTEQTLAILKPDCIRRRLVGPVIARIEEAGFKIAAMKMTRLTHETASAFYAVHRGKPFFDDLIEYMTSGVCIPIALEKENAIEDFRALIGATDPAQAAPGTIRKLFATSKQENIIHGSDSRENAQLEITFFFSQEELTLLRP